MKLLQQLVIWCLVVGLLETLLWLTVPGWPGAIIMVVLSLPPFGGPWVLAKSYT